METKKNHLLRSSAPSKRQLFDLILCGEKHDDSLFVPANSLFHLLLQRERERGRERKVKFLVIAVVAFKK